MGSGLSLGLFGKPAGEIREDDVGTGAFDRREMFEGNGVGVDPSAFASGMDHRVLAAHVIRRNGHVDVLRNVTNHIEIRERWLDHDHVGTFGEVEVDLADGLANVAMVLLVTLAVAAVGNRHVDGIAEWAVQRARVLG